MKLKISLLFVALYSGIACVFGQDVITLKTSEEPEVIITNVNENEVQYQNFNSQDNALNDIAQDTSKKHKKKSPGLACVLSLVLPGGGQYYNGQYVKGGIMTAIAAFSIGTIAYTAHKDKNRSPSSDADTNLIMKGFAAILVLSGDYLWSVIDAPIQAKKINKRNLLSWELGKEVNLSLRPDISINSSYSGNLFSPSYGAKLTLSLR